MKWCAKTPHFYVLVYLAIPVVIFWCGWFRWWVAAPAILAFSGLGWFWCKQAVRHPRAAKNDEPPLTTHLSLIIFLAFVWTYLAGVGGFRPQHFDYFKHNLIINNLVRYDWPVRYADGTYLCYYHAYYLPAVLLAKMVGGLAAVKYYIFGWTWLGLSLLFRQLSGLGGWKLVLFFMFFGCPEAILLVYEAIKSPHTIGYTLTDLWTNDHNIELIQTPGGLVFPSPVGAFTAVPQHALVAWLSAVFFLPPIAKTTSSVSHFAFYIPHFIILVLSLYWSPLVTAGLLPFVAYHFYAQKRALRNPSFLIFHCLLFFIIALPAFVFYTGHLPMLASNGWWWSFLKTPHQHALLGAFLALGVGFWGIILWFLERKYRILGKDAALIWLSLSILWGLSLYRYGHFNDLARRASLPATLVLCWGVFRLGAAWWATVTTKSRLLRCAFYILCFTLFILPLKHHLRWFTAQPYTAIVDKNIADFTPYSIHYLAKYHWGEFDVVAQYLGKANAWYSRYFAPPLPQKTRQITRAFYYWKSIFKLSNYEQKALKYHKISKLYVKYFDVDWNDATRQAVPKALIQFTENVPVECVPTVFITNRTLEKITWGGVAELAKKMTTLVLNAQPLKTKEIQIDCDWTPATRTKYFRLLAQIKTLLPAQTQLSATIRLHQIKFYRATGVPPVARGMLMYYNMADWKNPNTDNSILDLTVARRYADYISDYPLALDVVLPIFSWAIVHRNERPITIINHLKIKDLRQNKRFKALTQPNRFVALENHTAFGLSVRRGDVFRVEESTVEALQITSALLSQEIQAQNVTFAFYHLDSTNLANYAFPSHKQHPISSDSLTRVLAAFR